MHIGISTGIYPVALGQSGFDFHGAVAEGKRIFGVDSTRNYRWKYDERLSFLHAVGSINNTSATGT